MKLSVILTQLVCATALVVTDAALAYPCNRSHSVESNGTVRVVSNNGIYYQLVPASYQDQSRPYGFIGVAIEPLTPVKARELNKKEGFSLANFFTQRDTVPEVEGVLIVRLLQNGPAAQAGLTEGDVLLGVHGEMVTDVRQVQELISSSAIGQEIPVTFQRNKRVMTVMISAGDGRILKSRMFNSAR